MRSVVALAVLVVAPAASADPTVLLASRWPSVPDGHGLSLEDQITDRLTLLGNELGRHLDLLSHDMFQLKVDGRRRQAHVRIGGGDAESLSVRLDGDIQFDDINAHICAHVDLALRGHALHLELPEFEMSPVSYHGDYGVELRVPLFVQRF
ncbi:MAG TPA: hypothetical protein VK607_02580 [Kofleriaceae bacterium]|nr:hypothetical protein [Kofleriaceae bacterium]HMG55857.1 hypothetical protein [Kofleriaceae bacterium]